MAKKSNPNPFAKEYAIAIEKHTLVMMEIWTREFAIEDLSEVLDMAYAAQFGSKRRENQWVSKANITWCTFKKHLKNGVFGIEDGHPVLLKPDTLAYAKDGEEAPTMGDNLAQVQG